MKIKLRKKKLIICMLIVAILMNDIFPALSLKADAENEYSGIQTSTATPMPVPEKTPIPSGTVEPSIAPEDLLDNSIINTENPEISVSPEVTELPENSELPQPMVSNMEFSYTRTTDAYLNFKWSKVDEIDNIEYIVYRNSVPIYTGTEDSYSDTEAGIGNVYTYRVEAKDVLGNTIAQSSEIEVGLYEDMTISNNTILTENMTVSSILITNNAVLDLNGYSLTVYDDMTLSQGKIKINKGYLYCKKNFYQTGNNSMVYQQNINDYILIEGDYIKSDNSYVNSYCLSAGTLEVKGDFTQQGFDINGNNSYYFMPGENHKTILSGSKLQTVTLDDERSGFGILELRNYSEEGVYSAKELKVKTLLKNNCKLEYGVKGVEGWTLSEDQTLTGDIYLNMGELNLNGHTLVIKGNLIQGSGVININGGFLDIKGDYRIQSISAEETVEDYGVSSGRLIMTKAEDYVKAEGNFIIQSSINHEGCLTDGILEVKKDFEEIRTSTYSFRPTGNHKLLMSGEERQIIKIPDSRKHTSYINNMEITNQSESGVEISGHVAVIKEVNDNKNNVTGGAILCLADTVFADGEFSGNVVIDESKRLYQDLHIKGYFICYRVFYLNGFKLTVDGYTQIINTSIYIMNGQLLCGGDFILTDGDACMNMDNDNGYVLIEGNFYWGREYGMHPLNLRAGVIEIKGNLTQKTSSGEYQNSFTTCGSHKIILSGNSLQTIDIEDKDCIINILEIKNTSEEGIYYKSGSNFRILRSNGCKITCAREGTVGTTLSGDTVINGNLYLVGGEMNLNGYKLIINGNLIQEAGIVNINGGSLTVNGDYRIQAIEDSEESVYTYSMGVLNMTNEKDYVKVEGNFITASKMNHAGLLTEGNLEIKGNFEQYINNSYDNFNTSGNHTVILSGNNEQFVTMEYSSETESKFTRLEIRNQSVDGVEIAGNVYVTNYLNDNGNNVNGAVRYTENLVFENGVFNGNIIIFDNTFLERDLKIKGYIEICNNFYMQGKKVEAGEILHKAGGIYIKRGQLIVEDDYNMPYLSSGYINMCNDDDYVLVKGDFNISTTRQYRELTAGTLEIKGNFTQEETTNDYSNFKPSGSHKTILSGDSLQTVYFKNVDCGFNILEIKNYSKEGVYSSKPIPAVEFIRNGCKVNYDIKGEYGYTLTEDEEKDSFYLIGDELNLNGHVLTIKGNFTQMGGTVNVNNGTLIVEGDYLIQTEIEDNNSVVYEPSSGVLMMGQPEDYVQVKGDFITWSKTSHNGKLTNGLLEVNGNLIQKNVGVTDNLLGTENHTLLVKSDKAQRLSFESTSDTGSCLQNITIENSSEEGVSIEGELWIAGHIKDNGSKINGTVSMRQSTTFENNSFNGNIAVYSECRLQSDLNINGNLYIHKGIYLDGYNLQVNGCIEHNFGRIICNKGKLYCKGNYNMAYRTYSEIYMEYSEDYMLIEGNFIADSRYLGTCSNGIIEIKGNFIRSNYENLYMGGNHKIIMSGDKRQDIEFSYQGNIINILEIRNESEEGVHITNSLVSIKELIRNNNILVYPNKGMFGWTLTDDMVIEGNLVILNEELNLNGYNLIIKGNLIQEGGVVNINGGSLTVEESYRIQSRTGENTFGISSGKFVMTNEKDYVLIKEDFITSSTLSHNGLLTEGTLEVKGNFLQNNSNVYDNFIATENHKTILSGDKLQTVQMQSSSSCFNHLTINNISKDGIKIENSIWGLGIIEDNTQNVQGTLFVNNLKNIKNNKWSGSICAVEVNSLDSDFETGGGFIVRNNIRLNGNTLRSEYIELQKGELRLNGGKIYCKNNFSMPYSNDAAKFYMNDDEDYIFVGGDFTINTVYSQAGCLTAGLLEIQGDINNSSAFCTTGTHKTRLSTKLSEAGRAYKQNINFIQWEDCAFNILILTRDLETGYSINADITQKCRELIFDFEDKESPTVPQNVRIANAGGTSIALVWDASTDNERVAGYEIYRDNVKIASVSSDTYTDIGIQPEKSYIYYVKAFDASRNFSEASNLVSVMTGKDEESPEAPSNLKIKSRTGSSITISWLPSYDNTGVVKYEIIRNGEKLAEISGETVYKDKEIEANHIYIYQVRAIDSNNNISEFSNEAKGYLVAPEITFVSPMENTRIGGERVKLTVRYRNTGNAKGNKVKFEYSKSGEEWTDISNVMIGQSVYSQKEFYSSCDWNIKRLEAGLYKVRFTLYDEEMNTDEVITEYLVDTAPPEKPEEFGGVSENGIVKLIWSPSISADCQEYIIYRSIGISEEYEKIAVIQGRMNVSYTDKDVIEGIGYKYKVTASDKYSHESEFSDIVMVTVDKDMEAPKIISILPDSQRINKTVMLGIQAKDNIKVKYITLWYKEETQEEWTLLEKAEAVDGYTDISWETKEFNGNYILKAEAEDINGNISAKEFTRKYEVDNRGIAKIAIKDTVSTASTVSIRWEDVIEEDFGYFLVEKKTEEGWEEAGKTNDTLGLHVTGLKDNTEYIFRVTGYDNLGNRGVPSNEVKVTTKSDTQTPIVTRISPSADYYKGKIKLEASFSDDIGVTKGLFQYSTDKKEWIDIEEVTVEKILQNSSISCIFDTDSIQEGNIYVRVIAYDKAGNRSDSEAEPNFVEYIIDRTAPDKIKSLKAQGNQGYVELSWLIGTELDIAGYRIYRADEGSKDYRILEEKWSYLNFYDRTTKYGKVYSYKVAVIDKAGNISELSDEVVAQSEKDTEKPIVYSANPENGSTVSKNPQISALSVDNSCLKEVVFEYKSEDSEEYIWNEISVVSVNEQNKVVKTEWNTEGIAEGNYIIRITAIDMEGNISNSYEITYTLDITSPEMPYPQTTTQHRKIDISWPASEAQDIGGYEIFRKNALDKEYTSIANIVENNYTDESVEPGIIYLYKVMAYDKYGNYSTGIEIEGIADDVDEIPPIAVIPSDFAGMTGMELALDGSGSTDNVKITEYKWNMGNGDIVYGMQPVYTYDKAGDYYVILTVRDEAGNESKAYTNVKIYDNTTAATLKVKVTDENGNLLRGADVYLDLSENGRRNLVTDINGEASYITAAGTYMMAAYKSGYIAEDTEIILNPYETKEVTIVLKKGDIVIGNISVHRMPLEEMLAAGIDFFAPENYTIFVFNLKLVFEQSPIEWNYEYVVNVNGDILSYKIPEKQYEDNQGKGDGYNFIPKYIPYESTTSNNESIEEPPILVYMNTSESIKWLNDMYNVNLGIINNANGRITIEEAEAELILPDGMGLAKTKEGQTLKNSIGKIAGQETVNLNWYIQGYRTGTYKVGAKFTGTLMPFNKVITADFETINPFEVTLGEGIKIFVTPEAAAYPEEDYYIQFEIANNSSKTFYNFTHSFGNYENPGYKEYNFVIEDGEVKTEVYTGESYYLERPEHCRSLPVIQGGDKVEVGVFSPGESLYGTFKKEITYDDVNKNGELVYYRLIDTIVNKNIYTNIGVEVIVRDAVPAHIRKYITEIIELDYTIFDPIDMATGAYISEYETLKIDGTTALSFDLNYNSMTTENSGEMGKGWSHNYEMHIEEENGIAKVYWNSNQYNLFIKEEAVNRTVYGKSINQQVLIQNKDDEGPVRYICVSEGLDDNVLEKRENGTYYLRLSDGLEYEFDKSGKPIKATDSNGRNVCINRLNGMLVVSDEASGCYLMIKYNVDGKVSEVCDSTGRKVSFGYTGECLTSIKDPLGNTRTMTYDSKERIYTDTDAEGNVHVINVYDEKGRVISQDDGNPETPLSYLSYDEESEYGRTIITSSDRNKNIIESVSNNRGQIIRSKNKNGDTTVYTYDYKGNLASVRNANGDVTSYIYDDKGNLLSTRDNYDNTISMTYDSNGNVITMTDADGIITTYTYNEKNLMTSQSKQGTAKITYKYNQYAQLIEETTEGLGTKYYSYDTLCHMIKMVDYDGSILRYSYDGLGNVTSIVDRMGNTTYYEYDDLRRLIKEVDRLGNVIRYEYDKNGNKTKIINKDGTVTKNDYNSDGIITKITDSDGTVTEYLLDGEGNILKETITGTVKEGNEDKTSVYTTVYTYDGEGNILKRTVNGEESEEGGKTDTTSYTYDAMGNVLTETDNAGNTVTYTYYPNGKLHTITDSEGSRQIYTYDTHWRLKGITNPQGGVYSYEYDAAGNLIKEKTALGNETSYEYDLFGRCIKVTDARGNSTTYEYDKAGNVTALKDPYGNEVKYVYDKEHRLKKILKKKEENGETRTLEISMIYDQEGRNIITIDELGNSVYMDYDSTGNVTGYYDSNGRKLTTTVYDENNAPVSVQNILGLVTEYSYDALGRLKRITENNNNEVQTTTYEYDNLGRLIKVTDAEEGTSGYEYDNTGNIKKIINPNNGETIYTYDKAGRIKTEEILKGSLTTYTYNAAGLLEKKKDANGKETAFQYDIEGRITSFTDELGTVSYTYDENSNITEVKEISGGVEKTITRTFDKLNRVESYTDYEGNVIKYEYDSLGCLTGIVYSSNKKVSYEYYDNGSLKKVTDFEGNETEYQYDRNGMLTNIIRADGTVETRKYDPLGGIREQIDVKKTKGSEDKVINHYVYDYDKKGNIISKTGISENGDFLESASMKYDDINRLIEYNGEEVIYDNNGNMTYGPLDGEMSEYEYDCRNRLIKAGDITYEYDAENIRTGEIKGNKKTSYITDSNSGSMSKVLMSVETDVSQSVELYSENEETSGNTAGNITYYVYGNGLISQTSEEKGYLTYHYDNIGSTTAVTDINGNVKAEYCYGPYGELVSENVEGIRFLYNGKLGVMTDTNGLYYMRARYYNSQIKRFINQDVIVGSIENSPSLNRYSYVEGNPIKLTDPFGLCPISLSGIGHAFLNLLGMIPVAGEAFDAINALWYFEEGNVSEGFSSIMSGLPIVGSVIGGGVKLFKGGQKAKKAVKALQTGCRIASNMFTFGRAGTGVAETGKQLYKEYVKNGKSPDANLVLGIGGMVLNGAAMFFSGKSLVKDLKLNKLGNKLKNTVKNAVGSVKSSFKSGSVDIEGGSGAKETELFLPDEAYNKQLPKFVTPGTRILPKYDEFGNLKQIKYYDDYGREIGWIDFTNHGYPDNHTVPHWHEVQWNAQYPSGYKIDHRLDPNPPFDY